ncbi:leucine-rich repeat-containing protein 51-like [Rhodnius prolixus]|uniref:leucine-rich repeat-containing protein 51-like n=1 Tax=Rhodnius prolixus TaxID=13249 RepID=UPI003D18B3CC
MVDIELLESNVDVSNTPPADYSFRKVKSLNETEGLRPRSIRIGKEVVRGPSGKILSNGLWLNNNNLTSIRHISRFVNSTFEAPAKMEWLDFSYNQIVDIHEEILNFKNLKILYLHGNCIDNIGSIYKLSKLKHLRAVTLHGNLIEAVPFYRRFVIYFLPQIKCLDFVAISPREQKAPEPPDASAIRKKAADMLYAALKGTPLMKEVQIEERSQIKALK